MIFIVINELALCVVELCPTHLLCGLFEGRFFIFYLNTSVIQGRLLEVWGVLDQF